jgi:hypothetical protein
MGLKFREAAELEQRLAAVEARLAAGGNPNPIQRPIVPNPETRTPIHPEGRTP